MLCLTSFLTFTSYRKRHHFSDAFSDTLHCLGFLCSSVGKECTCQNRRCERCEFDPWVGKILWRRRWLPTPVFLPGESHGPKSLVEYIQAMESQRGRHDLATTPPPPPPLLAVALREYRLRKQLVMNVFSNSLPIYFISSTLRFMKEVGSM